MLKLFDVSKTFNPGTITEKKALKNINLDIEDGDFVTVIGGNGAGKSTLLNLIAGVHISDSGSIVLDGMDLTEKPEYKRAKYLGRVFQDPMLGTAANMEIEEKEPENSPILLGYDVEKERWCRNAAVDFGNGLDSCAGEDPAGSGAGCENGTGRPNPDGAGAH